MILFSSPICTYVALIDREKKDDKTVTVLRRKGIKGILIHFWFDSIFGTRKYLRKKFIFWSKEKYEKIYITRVLKRLNLEKNLSSIVKFSNAYSSRVSSEIKVFTFEREREIISELKLR